VWVWNAGTAAPEGCFLVISPVTQMRKLRVRSAARIADGLAAPRILVKEAGRGYKPARPAVNAARSGSPALVKSRRSGYFCFAETRT